MVVEFLKDWLDCTIEDVFNNKAFLEFFPTEFRAIARIKIMTGAMPLVKIMTEAMSTVKFQVHPTRNF